MPLVIAVLKRQLEVYVHEFFLTATLIISSFSTNCSCLLQQVVALLKSNRAWLMMLAILELKNCFARPLRVILTE